ncbi:unnamed protein product [Mesocestoides corti]|uniref:TFIIS N-terminal domain-containing protein n=1 Tax=Mesocestoides corti TaxID=53468 RepID=A0A3P6IBT7_MESCO|nr:unnamed protein product [Mesocestoides corti]
MEEVVNEGYAPQSSTLESEVSPANVVSTPYTPPEVDSHLKLTVENESHPDSDNEYRVKPLVDPTTPIYAPSRTALENEVSDVEGDEAVVLGISPKVVRPQSPLDNKDHSTSDVDEGTGVFDEEDRGEGDFEGFDGELEGTKGMIADIFGESDADEEEEFEGFAENEVENDMAASSAVPAPTDMVEREGMEDSGGHQQLQVDDDNEAEGGDEFVSDFDRIMSRRREETRRKRRLGKDDEFLNDSDDIIRETITRMQAAAEEDRRLMNKNRPATKKLSMLNIVSSLLKKADMKSALIDNGMLSAITDWLSPVCGQTLPNVIIRETLLRHLSEFHIQEPDLLRESGIGKAVMYLYMHPRETRANKKRAGHLINEWSRPIFNLTSDYRTLSKEERKQLDYEHLPKRRNYGNEMVNHRDLNREMVEQQGALRPGDPGWVNRARVPQPSNKDYVVRPKWNVPANPSGSDDEDEEEGESKGSQRPARRQRVHQSRFFKKSTDTGGTSSRIETHIRALAKKAALQKSSRFVRAVPMSVEGRKMSL